jgi:hypothetical protein
MSEEHKKHHIHFFVDGEQYQTEDPTLTPNYIISHYAEGNPATSYLKLIKPKEQSFQGRGEEVIKIHDGYSFQIIILGPTTVSFCKS